MEQIENIRHSLSHILATAVKKKFPDVKLGIGPVIENGFFYDFLRPPDDLRKIDGTRKDAEENRRESGISEADLPEIEGEMRKIVKEKYVFSGEKLPAQKV